MDVYIEQLRASAIIGTEPRERIAPQPVVLDLHLRYDATAAAESDDLAEAVDYAALTDRVLVHLAASRCRLLERLCREVLDVLLAEERVTWARVRIAKPSALPAAENVAIAAEGVREA